MREIKARKKGKKEVNKVGFWNVASLKNKNEEFWGRLKEWGEI